MLLQTCMSFVQLNTKEDILNNVGNQTVVDFHSICFPTVQVNGNRQLFNYTNILQKYLLLCSTEETKLIPVWNNIRVSK